jgi:hopene-associated glycosyltransferase HpnB
VTSVLVLGALSGLALLSWVAVQLVPWQPQRLRERLDADPAAADNLDDVTVLIPARDEADLIGRTVSALHNQGSGLAVIVIDDQSGDGTADVALRAAQTGAQIHLSVLRGAPLPPGWAGKLWALQQGLTAVDRPFVLLLDADIELAPRMLPTLRRFAVARGASLVSIMAQLHCGTFWERLLTPAFIFFFKLLYPFALVNEPARATAAAAGGCMLVRTEALRSMGGFAAIRGALIDDCALAAELKRAAAPIWLGVSRSVTSHRVYGELRDFWRMVSRSAFTQLRYSFSLLLLATAAMLIVLLSPLLGLAGAAVLPSPTARLGWIAGMAWLAMSAAYWPTVRFYRLPAAWSLTLPLAGALFLAMTWSSAASYWRGTRATWKNRSYETND